VERSTDGLRYPVRLSDTDPVGALEATERESLLTPPPMAETTATRARERRIPWRV
jgi:hypothetical protein